ncbi:MAG: hypothetical protein ABL928_09200 [Sphingorhabdus sp.]
MMMSFLFLQIFNFTIYSSSHSINNKISDDKVIVITENGVARKQDVSQKIFCKDVEWRIEWKSDSKGAIYKAKITYVDSKKSEILRDNEIELISKIKYLDVISASCNPSDDIRSTKSNLLILATDKETDEYILGKLVMDSRTRKGKWYFTRRD